MGYLALQTADVEDTEVPVDVADAVDTEGDAGTDEPTEPEA
jgi:hypothetical protein